MLSEVFVQYIGNSIKKNWELQALSDYKGEGFTYKEVAVHILNIHRLYKEIGIQRGDKVSLVGKNSARWCIVYLATVSYGAVIVPILPDFKPEDIQNIVIHSDSVLLFSTDAIYESFGTLKMDALKGIISLNTFGLLNKKSDTIEKAVNTLKVNEKTSITPDQFILPEVSNAELAVISYTSGTTGHSKGVMLNHNSLAANIRFAQNNMPLYAGDPIVSFLPLAHAYGCAFEFLFPSIRCFQIPFLFF